MKYKPDRDLPDFARQFKTLSPSKLASYILAKRNEEIDPSAITHWFARHPEISDKLRAELVQGLPTETQAVDSSIFENHSFEEIQSVKEWTTHLRVVRRVRELTIKSLVGRLRQICSGTLAGRKIDFVAQGKWCLKHPDRLTFQDGKDFLNLIIQNGFDPCLFAGTLKSFLVNKGITEASQFLVGKSASFGKFKELYVPKPTANAMLMWILTTYGPEAYAVDLLMFKRAYRIGAVIKANIEDFDAEQGKITLFEKGKQSKYGVRGKPVTQPLKPYLVDLLQRIAQGRLNGRFFSVTEEKMSEINMEALRKFAPEILAKYGHVNPNHFWRHECGQLGLRKTKWNIALVAKLYNWSPQALEESYGGMPQDIAEEAAKDILD